MEAAIADAWSLSMDINAPLAARAATSTVLRRAIQGRPVHVAHVGVQRPAPYPEGLPLGLQVIGFMNEDAALFAAAASILPILC